MSRSAPRRRRALRWSHRGSRPRTKGAPWRERPRRAPARSGPTALPARPAEVAEPAEQVTEVAQVVNAESCAAFGTAEPAGDPAGHRTELSDLVVLLTLRRIADDVVRRG